MIRIRQIGTDRKGDANIPNQPFEIVGKMVPSLNAGKWEYRTELFPAPAEICFPDCPYDPGEDDALFLGAYDGEECVGVAVLRKGMFRYLYLDDLKVNRDRRGIGIGGMLVEACMEKAKAEGMQGVYAIAQDNNLSACLFYLRHDFEIGGFDNRAYRGTNQEEKAVIFFYRDCQPAREE